MGVVVFNGSSNYMVPARVCKERQCRKRAVERGWDDHFDLGFRIPVRALSISAFT